MDLTDAQWELLAPLLPKYRRRKDGRGRPRQDLRAVWNGVLWILRTGAQWADLPDRYPPYQTCHRYFQEWSRDGPLKRILHALAEDLYDHPWRCRSTGSGCSIWLHASRAFTHPLMETCL